MIVDIIIRYYVHILLSIITGLFIQLRALWRAQKRINKAQTEGLQALLRSSIIGYYTRAIENDYMLVYQRDTVHKLYECYIELGGNGTVKKLVDDMMNLKVLHKVPTQKYYSMNEEDRVNAHTKKEHL